MDKLKMHSPNLAEGNIAKLAELFPNCVTESQDEQGNLKRSIDFDLLRQELSESIVEGPQERYHLNWPGKREALLAANAPIVKTLRPCREESVDFDTTRNLFIEGDNLDALKLLQETYLGKVKMIYIDPPYNTGNEFIYRDDFSTGRVEHDTRSGVMDRDGNKLIDSTSWILNAASNGRFHSHWLSMIHPRLRLARNLLKEDGVIFVSIDDNELHNLRKACDEIFGEGNFLGSITWEKRTKAQNTETARDLFQSKTEYILAFKKSVDKYRFNLEVTGEKTYEHSDQKGSFRYKTVETMSSYGMRGRGTMIFDIQGVLPGEGKQWKIGRDQVSLFEDRGDIVLIEGRPTLKVRPEDEGSQTFKPFWSHFFDKDTYGTAETGKSELSDLLGTKAHGFETVKPLRLIKKLLFHVKKTNAIGLEQDDIVLDFFAGSATTAHATMQINSEDGGRRRFIMVQLPEACNEDSEAFSAGFHTIAEISKERIRRAGVKLVEANATTAPNLDIGFRVLKVDTSNMDEVYYAPDTMSQTELFTENIKPDRSSEDLLFQILLDWGVDLSLPIVREKISGNEVYFVDGNALAACFVSDGKITEDFVKLLAERQPLRVVFRDAGFKDDSVKINVEQIFKLKSPHTDIKTI